MGDTYPFKLSFILDIEETFQATTVKERRAIAQLNVCSIQKNIRIWLFFGKIFKLQLGYRTVLSAKFSQFTGAIPHDFILTN